MKLIHTADVHLDMCFAGSGLPSSFGNRRRQSLRDVFQSIVQRAGEWPADALLIAGDLFEHERVSRDTIHFLMSQFRSIPSVPVFIAPGNHDPYVAGSPYATETWPENVTIFSSPEWTSRTIMDGALTVHGFGFDGPQISSNPFGKLTLPASSGDQVHVAVAHGSERGHQPPDKEDYAPFDAAEATPDGLAYLALGHFHRVTPITGDFETQVFYSGAPEGHSIRETEMHYYLQVKLDGGKVDVGRVPSSRIVYTSRKLSCDGFESSQDVIEAMRSIANEEEVRQIAHITLTGALAPDIRHEMGLMYDAAAVEFEHFYLLDETSLLDDYEELAREDTSLGAFIRSTNEEFADATDDAQRQKINRAREVGLAAFRMRDVEILGLERG